MAKARTCSVAVAYIFAKITTLKFITLRQNKLECLSKKKSFITLTDRKGMAKNGNGHPVVGHQVEMISFFLLSSMLSGKARKNKLKLIQRFWVRFPDWANL